MIPWLSALLTGGDVAIDVPDAQTRGKSNPLEAWPAIEIELKVGTEIGGKTYKMG